MNFVEYYNPQEIIKITEHRPNPLPDLPWVSTQRWEDVLFLHWPVSPDLLTPHLPQSLQLDLYDGTAWIGMVFFQVKGMRPRLLPAVPFISSYLQLNVRTYVTYKGRSGVYFFRLTVDSILACFLAKTWYSLPFMMAEIKMDSQGDDIHMVSKRKIGKFEERMSCSYTPEASVFHTQMNTLDHWLFERYCSWNMRQGTLLRIDIHHTKWNLQKAAAVIRSNTVTDFLTAKISQNNPIVHYSSAKQALFWPPVKERRF
ncbi:YqjF family protein [Bacillus benzoevorans]|uniref:DUF2071 domain-containing protein n=1 Tax=Bacillus benzoevorans TaxID=1456 RepID=A0A7X0LV57_9BACI|nr:DUF2071 domain-containing protein [Bacillus benzoevorans]MBB6443954.1 hypothetical protein [Bacillus benzoevorans]